MKLLKWYVQGREVYGQIYFHENNHWTLETKWLMEKPDCFCHVLKQYQEEIHFAVVDLCFFYIKTLYAIVPQIQIIMAPEALRCFVSYFFKEPVGNEEVAVGLDWKVNIERDEIQNFLDYFYQSRTVEEAKVCYINWQYSRDLQCQAGNKLLVLMNFYEEEIFNYFKYRLVLSELTRI